MPLHFEWIVAGLIKFQVIISASEALRYIFEAGLNEAESDISKGATEKDYDSLENSEDEEDIWGDLQ